MILTLVRSLFLQFKTVSVDKKKHEQTEIEPFWSENGFLFLCAFSIIYCETVTRLRETESVKEKSVEMKSRKYQHLFGKRPILERFTHRNQPTNQADTYSHLRRTPAQPIRPVIKRSCQ